MKRDTSIETFRCLLMFGICLLHSITQGGHNVPWASNCLLWCVPGFVFISGWCGIKFSMGKVFRLYGISLYCAVVFVIFDTIANSSLECFSHVDLLRIIKIAKGQWFLNAYVVVMCLAPMINLAIERMTIKELNPLLLLVFVWSFATTLPISGIVPLSPGLTDYSFLTLLGIYVVARFTRKLYDEGGEFHKVVHNKKVVLLILGTSLIMASIGFGEYNSPFAVLIAGGAFFIFRNLTVKSRIGNICIWLGPSMFSVYLIHSHGQAWGYLKMIEDWALGNSVPMPIAYLLTAFAVFVTCLLLDLPRRVILAFSRKIL